MLSVEQALDSLAIVFETARRAGADAADGIYIGDAADSISVRLGQLEDISRSEGEELGIRVFVGTRSASVSTSNLAPDSLAPLAERAVAMAREAPEDEYAGLAPPELLMTRGLPDLDLDDGREPLPDALRERALAAEEAGRAVPGVASSEGASASAGRAVVALATSAGFARGYLTSSYSTSASLIAGQGTAMQRDYAYRTTRHLDDLEAPESIGRRAAQRAVARLNPVKLKSEAMPVVFDPRVGASLLGHFAGAINGASIARGTSFLMEHRGRPVFALGIRIIDDPLRVRGLRSRPFDGEGLPTATTTLIEDGVLTTWLIDSASGRQLGEPPTGHATRGLSGPPGAGTSNLYMEAGTVSRDDLIGDIRRGFYVTELIGMGVNGITGDYSRGAAGFLIENGELGHAVAEVTIAGNLKSMFMALTPANDLEFKRAVDVPTCRIEGMTVAGA
jgi:PmbA protein